MEAMLVAWRRLTAGSQLRVCDDRVSQRTAETTDLERSQGEGVDANAFDRDGDANG
jgi:hypothetical protein